jgi:PD-(D/E)XK endonuclease
MNTKQLGARGLGAAIAFFTKNGYNVSIPITDTQRYDLVIETDNQLQRVEVKSSSFQRKNYECKLSTCGGNQSGAGRIKYLSSKECDLVFIYCDNGVQYLFPSSLLDGKGTISLAPKYDDYKVI